jgi:hypothetical protein
MVRTVNTKSEYLLYTTRILTLRKQLLKRCTKTTARTCTPTASAASRAAVDKWKGQAHGGTDRGVLLLLQVLLSKTCNSCCSNTAKMYVQSGSPACNVTAALAAPQGLDTCKTTAGYHYSSAHCMTASASAATNTGNTSTASTS